MDLRARLRGVGALVTSSGYLPCAFDGINRYYLRQEDAALVPAIEGVRDAAAIDPEPQRHIGAGDDQLPDLA